MAKSQAQDRSISKRNLPVLAGPRADTTSARPATRFDLPASFAAHLIAARDRFEPQRARRRAPLNAALGAYSASQARTVRRLPAGYARALDA